MPTLIMLLSHKERLIRQATIKLMNELAMMEQESPKVPNFHSFILALISRDEEILIDEG